MATLTKIVPTSGVRLPALGIGTYKGFDRADSAANRARLDAEGRWASAERMGASFPMRRA